MSARAYIQYADVPDDLIASSRQRIDSETGAKLVGFEGCPITGQIEECDGALEVEFPFPRASDLRESLVNWFVNFGICFQVVM